MVHRQEIPIKIDGATCRNNNHFEYPTILNAPWDAHSMMFFQSVADLHFTGPFAVLGKPSTNIDHSMPLQTDAWTLPNVLLTFYRDLDLDL